MRKLRDGRETKKKKRKKETNMKYYRRNYFVWG
jgi:hypothetical protein